MQQGKFPSMNWGGARKGAGRPKVKGSGVPHTKREKITKSTPVFVTQRIKSGLPHLRYKRSYAVIETAIADHNREWGNLFRVVDYTVIGDHLHLLVEAHDNEALSRGLQGLFIRMTKRLNAAWGRRKGRVFRDRYDARVLRSPREVRNRLRYLYGNGRKHGYRLEADMADPCSSGPWFDGWRNQPRNAAGERRVTAAPRTWLRRVGWRKHGLLLTADKPGRPARSPA